MERGTPDLRMEKRGGVLEGGCKGAERSIGSKIGSAGAADGINS